MIAMDTITDISQTLKAAREAKGLSQRALAERAGVPQSHISKIETTGVDLRISSLVEIARALDLELALVPRKSMSAVKSVVRSAQPAAPQQSAAITKALAKLQSATDKLAHEHNAAKEAVQLQNRIQELSRLALPLSSLESIEKLARQIKAIAKAPDNLPAIRESLDQVQILRNQLAHGQAEQTKKAARSAYSLEEDDHG